MTEGYINTPTVSDLDPEVSEWLGIISTLAILVSTLLQKFRTPKS